MIDAEYDPADESTYECHGCGATVVSRAFPGTCSNCGETFRNRAMPME